MCICLYSGIMKQISTIQHTIIATFAILNLFKVVFSFMFYFLLITISEDGLGKERTILSTTAPIILHILIFFTFTSIWQRIKHIDREENVETIEGSGRTINGNDIIGIVL